MPTLIFNLKYCAPFDRIFNIGKGGRLPQLMVQVLDGVSPVSLVGATVKFTMVDASGTVVVNAQAGTLISGANGIVGYNFAANDVATAGRYYGKFNITVGGVDYVVPDGAAQNLVINVNTAPPIVESTTITSALTAAGTVGNSFTYNIVALNSPTSYAATPLPTGLSVSGTTGAITGTPTIAGTTGTTVSATNADGTATAQLTITIS